MLTLIIGGTIILGVISLMLIGVYKIKPELFKFDFEVKKILTMRIEIAGHARKSLKESDNQTASKLQ
jgi:hypothetical protein